MKPKKETREEAVARAAKLEEQNWSYSICMSELVNGKVRWFGGPRGIYGHMLGIVRPWAACGGFVIHVHRSGDTTRTECHHLDRLGETLQAVRIAAGTSGDVAEEADALCGLFREARAYRDMMYRHKPNHGAPNPFRQGTRVKTADDPSIGEIVDDTLADVGVVFVAWGGGAVLRAEIATLEVVS
jgi:hypothetical protein